MNIFELVKNNNINTVEKFIKKYPNFDYNISDQNISNELLINYCINLNHYEILEKLLKQNIQLDNLDLNGNSILYNPIKNKQDNILNLLLNNDNKVGLSICSIKDNNNLTALHYAIYYNNKYAIDLIYKKTNLMLFDNENNNFIQYAGINNNEYCINLILSNKTILSKFIIQWINHQNNNKETILHIICKNKNKILINYFINIINKYSDINLDIQDDIKQYTFIHYLCELNDIKNIIQLLNKININLCDIKGNTINHILANNQYFDLLDIIINHYKNNSNKTINFNKYNTNLEYPLHILLKYKNIITLKNLEYIIDKTNLNFADNNGNTCLFLLCKMKLWNNFKTILENKKLNIFVKNKLNQTIVDVIDNSNDFLNMILNNHNNLINNKKNISIKDFKKNKIKKFIEKYSTNDLNTLSTFSGLSFDMLCGLKYLEQNKLITACYNLEYLDLLYCKNNSIHNEMECSLESNFIKWVFDTDLNKFKIQINNTLIEKYLNNLKTKYLVIFMILENENNKHANMLIINNITKEVERYDPYGLSLSISFNYTKLDIILSKFFDKFYLKYINPINYLEYINLQQINNNIDTDNYCIIWCIWLTHIYIDSDINRQKLIKYIVDVVNKMQYKYKNIINKFNNEIIEIRNNIFNKLKIDFNDYYNGYIKKTTLQQLIIELNNYKFN